MGTNDITTLLTMLRFSDPDTPNIIRKIKLVKTQLNHSDFKKIINGDKIITLGSTEYSLVSQYNTWSLKSQIEYEINIRKNKTLGELYQYVKSL
jgi:hypothetical protein